MTNKALVRVVFDQESIKKVLEIRRIVFQVGQNVSPLFENDGEDFKIDSCKNFLAEINGRPAGTCRIRTVYPFLKLERVSVLEEYREHGVGKELVNFVQNYATENFPNLLLKSFAQLDVVGFYSKLGWIPVDENVIIEQNIGHYLMIYPPKTVSLIENLEIMKIKNDSDDNRKIIKRLESL